MPVLGLLGVVYSRRARAFGHSLQAALADNTASASEVLFGIRHVRLFDQERYEEIRSVTASMLTWC